MENNKTIPAQENMADMNKKEIQKQVPSSPTQTMTNEQKIEYLSRIIQDVEESLEKKENKKLIK